MKTRRMIMAAGAAAAAFAVAGCGEFQNTIHPQPGTTTNVPVMFSGPPTGLMAGVYEAMALGYYKQADMRVLITVPSTGENPLTKLHNFKTEVAVSSAPNVLLRREQNVPVVSVGAIIQKPLSSVTVKVPVVHKTSGCKTKHCKTAKSKHGKHTATKTTITTSTVATTTNPHYDWRPGTVATNGPTVNSELTVPKKAVAVMARKDIPTYQGLVFVVRPDTIVNNAPSIRRFLQTTARGYEAARQNPAQAINNMVKIDPRLASQQGKLLAELKAYLPDMFPGIQTVGKSKGSTEPWGFQNTTEWNTFGNWLHERGLISDPEAVNNASDNELLAGKGV
jgi:putative hydroxymethylpyrimidine transport system substrate-binding protein